MRAVAVTEAGERPVVTEMRTPQPGPGEIAIKVEAAGMNPMDWKFVAGASAEALPVVPGADVAGVVDALGEGVTRFSPGEELFGQVWTDGKPAGTYAEEVVVTDDAALAPVPNTMDATIAAALPTAGCTGLDLVESLQPLDGKLVLIVGAGGGVGSFATQFAANAGAHVIANTHQTANGRMHAYGAAETVDRANASVVDAVNAAHPHGIDVLIDLVSDRDAFAEVASLVRPGGSALSVVGAADVEALASDGITGINYGVQVTTDLLRRVSDAIVAGRIDPPPITEIQLDDVPAAWEATHADGKTIITPGPEGTS
jgi:NADPH2:quinone reductase